MLIELPPSLFYLKGRGPGRAPGCRQEDADAGRADRNSCQDGDTRGGPLAGWPGASESPGLWPKPPLGHKCLTPSEDRTDRHRDTPEPGCRSAWTWGHTGPGSAWAWAGAGARDSRDSQDGCTGDSLRLRPLSARWSELPGLTGCDDAGLSPCRPPCTHSPYTASSG